MRLFLSILALLLLCSGTVSAQDGPIFHLDSRQGLSQRIVYDIHEGKDGFMWFATRDGLNRYDGHHFKVFRHEPGVLGSISDSKVMSIAETPDGSLWIGTMAGGLNKFDRKTEQFKSWRHEPGNPASIPSDRIDKVVFDGEHSLYLSTRSGDLARFDLRDSSISIVPLNVDGIAASVRLNVFPLDDGRLTGYCRWTPEGMTLPFISLSLIDPSTGKCTPFGPNITSFGHLISSGNTLLALFEISGRIPIGSDLKRGLYLQAYSLPDLEPTATTFLPDLALGGIYSAWVDDPGSTIWISGLQDVIRVDDLFSPSVTVKSLSTPPFSLVDARSFDVLRDSKDNLWIGTHGGITLQRNLPAPLERFAGINPPSRIEEAKSVNTVLELEDGNLLIGSNDGLYRWSGRSSDFSQKLSIQGPPDLPSQHPDFIRRIKRLSDGTILIGTSGWLYRIEAGSNQIVLDRAYINAARTPPNLPYWPSRVVLDIIEDSKNQIWVVGANQVVVGKTGESWLGKVSFDDGLISSMSSHNLANTVFESSDGTIWIGNDNGLYRVDEFEGRFTASQVGSWSGDAACSSTIWDIEELEGTPGTLWLASVGGGLLSFDTDTGAVECHTTLDGLPSNVVYALQSHGDHGIWFSSTLGLGYYDILTGDTRTFTREQGLHDDEFDLASSARGQSGKLYFGGPTGMTFFDPDLVLQPRSRPNLVVSEVSVFDEPRPGIVATGDTLVFASDEEAISLRLSTLNFGSPSAGRFRYRLADLSDRWISTDPNTQVIGFNNLPPGFHRLEVGYIDEAPGSASDTFVYLHSRPPFWRTYSFYGLVVVVLFLATTLLFERSRANVRREEQDKAAQATEMARIVAARTEQERGIVARTLHDGPIQTLYALNHQLEMHNYSLDNTKQTILGIAEEIRDVCDQLRPKALDVLGLRPALEGLHSRVTELAPEMMVTSRLPQSLSEVPLEIAEQIYWISQTALINVLRHSKASQVAYYAGKVGDHWLLRVEDDGIGFQVPKDLITMAQEKHFGLIGIQERVERFDGTMTLRSIPGEGTMLEIMFPVLDQA